MEVLSIECRLSQLLEQVCQLTAALDPPVKYAPAMFEQIAAARPDIWAQCEAAVKGKPESDALLMLFRAAIGAGVVMQVKEVPDLVAALVQRIRRCDSPPALRRALVAVLAYVAQPRDIEPDDALGGYGFLDDTAMLIASALMITPATQANAAQIDKLQRLVATLLSFLPESARPAKQLAVLGVAPPYQTMSVLPPQLAETKLRQLLDNPESASAPTAPHRRFIGITTRTSKAKMSLSQAVGPSWLANSTSRADSYGINC